MKIRVGSHFLILGEPKGCDCEHGILFVDGQGCPEYTSMSNVALKKVIKYIKDDRLFWAVHLRDRHILDVQDDEGRSVRQGGKF